MPSTPLLTITIAAAAGALLVVLSERLAIPSIALLLVGGVLLGPEGLGWVDPAVLGGGLSTIVALAVAIILFEAGFALELRGFRRAPGVVRRMLWVGVLVGCLGTAAAMHWLLEVPLLLAVLGGSLAIVTGPAVVSPILRRTGIQDRLHRVLHWEAVLVDAIGLFLAALVYEWLVSGPADGSPLAFGLRVLIGLGAGAAGGLLLSFLLRRNAVTREHAPIVVIGFALLLFGVTDAVARGSGVLAALTAGVALRQLRPPHLRRLRRARIEAPEVGIALVFVLLSARLDLGTFVRSAVPLLALLGIVLFVVRPLYVWLSTAGKHFSLREKILLSWIEPRGLVTAAMAVMFSIELQAQGYLQAAYLEMFMFSLIGATVLLQGLTASSLARALGLEKPLRQVWMLTGEPELSCGIARGIEQAGAEALVVDPHCREVAEQTGVPSLPRSPTSRELLDDPRVHRVGAVLAVGPDGESNRTVCRFWAEHVGRRCSFRFPDSADDPAATPEPEPPDGVPIWRSLPPPRELARSLVADEVVVSAVDVGSDDTGRFHSQFAPLFSVRDGRVDLVPDPTSFVPDGLGSVVVLRRRVPGLAGLVRDAVVVSDPDADLYRVVRHLLEVAGERDPKLPTEDLLYGILERERTMSTAMGLGVIIPHTYHPRVDRSQCVVANVVRGIKAEGAGGDPVHLVFLVVSPVGQAQLHLQSLAAIARLVDDPHYRSLLARQRTSQRLLQLIRERE